MKRVKRLGTLLLALCMLFSFAPAVSAASGTIQMTLDSNTMTVNGETVQIDTDPAIKPQVKTIDGKGYTMLPLRAVVESLGGTVAYDAATKVITLTYGDSTLMHAIGTDTATVNGETQTMAIASYAENNRTYVHLRAIELLSADIQVLWSQDAPKNVEITCIPARVSAEIYDYDISGQQVVIDGQVFDGDITITGENGMIVFVNCAFNGNLINQGGEGARVSISDDCEFSADAVCVLDTTIGEATLETDLPKFLIFCEMPETVCETAGAIVTTADKPIRLNGEEYPVEAATFYMNEGTGEMDEYTGQEANIHNFAKWIEGGETVLMHIALYSE